MIDRLLPARVALLLLPLLPTGAASAQAPRGPYPGPTRRAFLDEDRDPGVRFAASLDGADARAMVDQAFALLHGGMAFEAERSFRQAAARQPGAALPWLGAALASSGDPARARYFVAGAVARRASAPPRERALVDAFAAFFEVPQDSSEVSEAAGNLHGPYGLPAPTFRSRADLRTARLLDDLAACVAGDPTDLEVGALFAREVRAAVRAGLLPADRRTASVRAATAVLDRLARERPRHPARLHFLDLDVFGAPDRALAAIAAAVPFAVADVTAHARAGTALLELHRPDDALAYFDAALRAAHAYQLREWTMSFLIDGYADAAIGRAVSLSHLGRVDDALAWHAELADLPRHPSLERLADPRSLASRNLEAFVELCVDHGCADALDAWENAGRFAPTRDDGALVPAQLTLAAAWLALGAPDRAAPHVDATRARLARLGDDPSELALARRLAPVWQRIVALGALHDAAPDDGAPDDGALDAGAASDRTPGLRATALRPTEHADRLLAAGRCTDAVEVLAREDAARPGRSAVLARLARASAAAGDPDGARAALGRLGRAAGRADRSRFASIDALAAELGIADGAWRRPRDPIVDWPRDLGPRPDAHRDAPSTWPRARPRGFALRDQDGAPATLEDHHGRPTVVVLYLGFGCLHCVEQLQLFDPFVADFRARGIDFVAIGTDTVDGLRSSLGKLPLGDRPTFPMLSDRKLRVFREWLAFDEFEHAPVHGTFLLDAAGAVRWHEIGYAPFEEPEWLLAEAERLLRLPPR